MYVLYVQSRRKRECFKCCLIKKQIEAFHIHPSTRTNRKQAQLAIDNFGIFKLFQIPVGSEHMKYLWPCFLMGETKQTYMYLGYCKIIQIILFLKCVSLLDCGIFSSVTGLLCVYTYCLGSLFSMLTIVLWN